MRTVTNEIRRAQLLTDEELYVMAKEIGAPYDLLKETAKLGRLPVVNFAAGGVATPADAALMMQLGCDGVFVGSGIFKSGNAAQRAKAIVQVGPFQYLNGLICFTDITAGRHTLRRPQDSRRSLHGSR